MASLLSSHIYVNYQFTQETARSIGDHKTHLLLKYWLHSILGEQYPELLDPIMDEDFTMCLEMRYPINKFLLIDLFAETVKGNWKLFSMRS